MVGLQRAGGDHRVGAGLGGVRHQIFELPSLVATGGEAGAIVPLHIDPRPAQAVGEARQEFERRRALHQADAVEAVEDGKRG